MKWTFIFSGCFFIIFSLLIAPFRQYREQVQLASNLNRALATQSNELMGAKAELSDSEKARLRRLENGRDSIRHLSPDALARIKSKLSGSTTNGWGIDISYADARDYQIGYQIKQALDEIQSATPFPRVDHGLAAQEGIHISVEWEYQEDKLMESLQQIFLELEEKTNISSHVRTNMGPARMEVRIGLRGNYSR